MVKTKKGVSANTLSHPNSRKVRQLTKQVKKEEARKKSKMIHQMKLNLMGEKFMWFRDNLPSGSLELDHIAICQLIQKYLERFDEELEQIKLKHGTGQRKNRQHASREDVIKITKQQDKEEFNTSGIVTPLSNPLIVKYDEHIITELASHFQENSEQELPNLLMASQVELLHKWNGELRFLQNFKLRRFSQQFLKNGNFKSSSSTLPALNSNMLQNHDKVEDDGVTRSEIMETDVEENKT